MTSLLVNFGLIKVYTIQNLPVTIQDIHVKLVYNNEFSLARNKFLSAERILARGQENDRMKKKKIKMVLCAVITYKQNICMVLFYQFIRIFFSVQMRKFVNTKVT